MIRFLKSTAIAALLAANPLAAPAEGLGIGLASPVDWSTSQPLLNLMKTARPWIGHGADDWEVMSADDIRAGGYLDAQGWPTQMPPGVASLGTLVLTQLPQDAGGVVGRYVLTWEGTGEIEVDLGAENVIYGPNRIEFDYTPSSEIIHVAILSTDPAGSGDYIRNIEIVRQDREALYDAGEIFNPDWLALLEGFEVLRFMDWGHTNDSTLAHWADRAEPDDAMYRQYGVPVEVMIRLANETGTDPWFNIPHLADDDYIRQFAQTLRDGLDPSLKAYVEFSNEVWNWGFDQAHWADEEAKALWKRHPSWVQFYGGRASEMADILAEVYGDEAEARLVRVISTQTGWLGLEEEILNAPKWVADEKGRTAPGEHFDAYAITGYFGGHLGDEAWVETVRGWITESKAAAEAEADGQGLTGAARDAFLAQHRFDLAVTRAYDHLAGGDGPADEMHDVPSVTDELFPYHLKVAQDWGLELVAYEAGTHVVAGWEYHDDEELNDFFIHLNYTPEMATLYEQLLAGWEALDAGPFVAFLDVERPSKYGSWGHLRHLGDANPRWDALVAARDKEASE